MVRKFIAAFLALTIYISGGIYYTAQAESKYEYNTAKISRDVTDEERQLLYDIGWAEARGEGKKGIILVINVIFNRRDCPSFPDTIHGVIFDRQHGVQFSPTVNGSLARATPCQYIKDAVQMALDGADYSQGATFFRTVTGAEGSWHERALKRIFTYGNHHFYVLR